MKSIGKKASTCIVALALILGPAAGFGAHVLAAADANKAAKADRRPGAGGDEGFRREGAGPGRQGEGERPRRSRGEGAEGRRGPGGPGGPEGGMRPGGPDGPEGGMRPGGPGGPGGPGPDFLLNDRAKERLNLSDEQVEKIKTLNDAQKESMDKLHEDTKALRDKMRELMDGDEPDTKAATKLVEEIGKSQIEIEKAMVLHQIKVKEILTAEQRGQLKEMREKRQGRVEERRGRMQDMRDEMQNLSPEERRERMEQMRDEFGRGGQGRRGPGPEGFGGGRSEDDGPPPSADNPFAE